jgi:biopolymer transport protein ExbB/TolQ
VAMLSDPRKETRRTALESSMRASMRSAAATHVELTRGMEILPSVARTAPWVGVFGTAIGIANSFAGGDGERSQLMAALALRLAGAIEWTAVGVAIALMAAWFYRYLLARVEVFDSEMEAASFQLINTLSLFRPSEPRSSI